MTRCSTHLRKFVALLFGPQLTDIEAERRALILKRAEAKRMHRSVADIDNRLMALTNASMNAARKPMFQALGLGR